MQIEYIEVEKLKKYENNARVHSAEQIEQIAKSIVQFGFNDPVEITDSKIILSGHARVLAAESLGWTSVPTITHKHLSDANLKGYILAANKIAQNAEWDEELLKTEIIDLIDDDFDLSLIGFNDDEISELIKEAKALEDNAGANADEAPGEPKEARVNRGEVWLLGEHRLMCGDSAALADVKNLMAGKLADMVFTDPPYNCASENKGVSRDLRGRAMHKLMQSDWDKGFNPRGALDCLLTVLAQNVSVYISTSHHLAPDIWAWMKEWSTFNSYCVWSKSNPMPSLMKRHWTWNTELICYATRGKHVFNFPEAGNALSTFTISKSSKCDLHPTMKPPALVEHILEHSSNEGQTILDLFGGSGTTLIACEKMGRTCNIMEIDPIYATVILDRWEQYTGKQGIKSAE